MRYGAEGHRRVAPARADRGDAARLLRAVLVERVGAGLPRPGQRHGRDAFLDALAHHRRALGLPAVAINWGLSAEVGRRPPTRSPAGSPRRHPAHRAGPRASSSSSARSSTTARRSRRSPRTGRSSRACSPRRCSRTWPRRRRRRASRRPAPRAEILAAEPAARLTTTEDVLVPHVARVSAGAPAKVDVHRPLNGLGIDSLMAVELKNRIESDLGIALPGGVAAGADDRSARRQVARGHRRRARRAAGDHAAGAGGGGRRGRSLGRRGRQYAARHAGWGGVGRRGAVGESPSPRA